MAKKVNGPESLLLRVGTHLGDVGFCVEMEYQEEGYYLGEIAIGDKSFHVEAVEVEVEEEKRYIGGKYAGTSVNVRAKNSSYHDRIEMWERANSTSTPQFVEYDGRKYFVHAEPYAA